MYILKVQLFAVVAAGTLLAAPSAIAADNNQSANQMEGQAVVTVLSGAEIPGGIPQDALHLKIDGKTSNVTGWTALRNSDSPVQLVVLIDNAARSSLGVQLNDIAAFIKGLPANAQVGVAYMDNGRAVFSGPLTGDHAAAARELHLPMAGMPGISGSPYFCLSDLANYWPSTDTHARREVVMLTNGVDNYEVRYNPDDPYVQAAIQDAVRAHLIVYSIYWSGQGLFGRTGYAAVDGQNLLAEVAEATGGNSYWQGYGNPVTLQPYFANIDQRLNNQYELEFMAPVKGKPQMANMKLQLSRPAKVDAPQQVYVRPAGQ